MMRKAPAILAVVLAVLATVRLAETANEEMRKEIEIPANKLAVCKYPNAADIVLVIDNNGLSAESFVAIKKLLGMVTLTYDLGERSMRFSIMTFTSKEQIKAFDLCTHCKNDRLYRAIMKIDWQKPESAGGHSGSAMEFARTTMFRDARPNARKLVVLIGTEPPSSPKEAKKLNEEVGKLKEEGIDFVMVMIGEHIFQKEMKKMIPALDEERFHYLPGLNVPAGGNKFAEILCDHIGRACEPGNHRVNGTKCIVNCKILGMVRDGDTCKADTDSCPPGFEKEEDTCTINKCPLHYEKDSVTEKCILKTQCPPGYSISKNGCDSLCPPGMKSYDGGCKDLLFGLIAMPLHFFLVFDASANTGQSGFEESKLFIVGLLNRFVIGKESVTFTLIYSSGSDVRIMVFDGTESTDSYVTAVFNLQYKGGESKLPELPDYATTFLKTANPRIQTNVLLIGSFYVKASDKDDVRHGIHVIRDLKWAYLFFIPFGEKLNVYWWKKSIKPEHIIPLYNFPPGRVYSIMHSLIQWINLHLCPKGTVWNKEKGYCAKCASCPLLTTTPLPTTEGPTPEPSTATPPTTLPASTTTTTAEIIIVLPTTTPPTSTTSSTTTSTTTPNTTTERDLITTKPVMPSTTPEITTPATTSSSTTTTSKPDIFVPPNTISTSTTTTTKPTDHTPVIIIPPPTTTKLPPTTTNSITKTTTTKETIIFVPPTTTSTTTTPKPTPHSVLTTPSTSTTTTKETIVFVPPTTTPSTSTTTTPKLPIIIIPPTTTPSTSATTTPKPPIIVIPPTTTPSTSTTTTPKPPIIIIPPTTTPSTSATTTPKLPIIIIPPTTTPSTSTTTTPKPPIIIVPPTTTPSTSTTTQSTSTTTTPKPPIIIIPPTTTPSTSTTTTPKPPIIIIPPTTTPSTSTTTTPKPPIIIIPPTTTPSTSTTTTPKPPIIIVPPTTTPSTSTTTTPKPPIIIVPPTTTPSTSATTLKPPIIFVPPTTTPQRPMITTTSPISTTQTPLCDPCTPSQAACSKAKAVDLVILVDASTDMGKTRLQSVKKFMKKFISKRPSGRLEPRFSILTYGSRSRPNAWFKQCIKIKKCVQIAEKRVKPASGKPKLGEAIKYSLKYAFQMRRRMRKGTRRGIIVISSGKTYDLKWTKAQAGKAERLKKNVFFLGVGDKMDKKMIDSIAPGKRQFKLSAAKLLKSKKVMKWLEGIYIGCNIGKAPTAPPRPECKLWEEWHARLHKCVEKQCHCRGEGDPHYHRYDGSLLNFMGICKYVFSKSTNTKDTCAFSVEVKNEHRKGWGLVAWTRLVDFKMGGYAIRLHKDMRTFKNGQLVNLPFAIKTKGGHIISVWKAGPGIRVDVPSCTIHLTFSLGHAVTLTTGFKRYGGKGKLTGICGECGVYSYGSGGSHGKSSKDHHLDPNSFSVPDDSDLPLKQCKRVKEPTIKCSTAQNKIIANDAHCGLMMNTEGLFKACIKSGKVKHKNNYQSCKMDVCAHYSKAKARMEAVCASIGSFATECQKFDFAPSKPWRTAKFCPMKCPTNSDYNPKMNPCQPNCVKQTCKAKAPVEGCQCKKGYLLSGQACVAKAKCGCLDGGDYLLVGETRTAKDCKRSMKCVKAGGKVKVLKLKPCGKNASCTVGKGGHYQCTCKKGYHGNGNSCKKVSHDTAKPTDKVICSTAKAVDLVLLVDASTTMGKEGLEYVKKFMKKFISKRPSGRLEPRFSILTYGSRTRPSAWFKQCIKIKKCVQIAEKRVKPASGKPQLGEAIKYSLKYAFQMRRRMRKGTRRGIIVISSGKTYDLKWTKAQAGKAERLKKNVFFLGVGDKMDKKMIDSIAPGKRQFKLSAAKLLKSKKVMKWLDDIYTGCDIGSAPTAAPKMTNGKQKPKDKKKKKKKGSKCVPKAVDIVVLVDTSNFLGKKSLKIVKSFLKKAISGSPNGALGPQFSIIQYDKRTRAKAWFKQCKNKARCASVAQKKIKFGGGQAAMGKALRYALKYAFQTSRKIRTGTRRAILVINGGKSKDRLKTMAAADKAFKLKRPVYSLTIGAKLDLKLLQHISPGKRQLVIPAGKLSKSKKVMTWLQTIYTGCIPS
ncbi:uncharacterized protein LOC135494847 isoform X1 [Lineus longissimus]|uniref:uncharacterized protein LOC135494847 isoform X1 n=1 Tax=Lineus longissimus TaxID=88925 RepID=UPI00315E013E